MSEQYKITGTVYNIGEIQTFDSGFCKRVMVIETDEKYPQKIPVEAFKDKCSMFEGIEIGDKVTAFINLRGSEWNDRFFLSANCWKIESVDGKEYQECSDEEEGKPPNLGGDCGSGLDDDIPF